MDLTKEEKELIEYSLKQTRLENNKNSMNAVKAGITISKDTESASHKLDLLIYKFEKENKE